MISSLVIQQVVVALIFQVAAYRCNFTDTGNTERHQPRLVLPEHYLLSIAPPNPRSFCAVRRNLSQRMKVTGSHFALSHRGKLSDRRGAVSKLIPGVVVPPANDHEGRFHEGRLCLSGSSDGQRRNNAKADSPFHHQSSVATQG